MKAILSFTATLVKMRPILLLTAFLIGLAIAGKVFAPSLQSLPALSFMRDNSDKILYQRLYDLSNDKRMGTLYDVLQEVKTQQLDLDHRSDIGLRALEIAAIHDQGQAAAAIVVAGADINGSDTSGDTVMHIAVRHHSLHVLKELRHFMPALDRRNKDGLTALDLARRMGDDAAVAILTAPLSAS